MLHLTEFFFQFLYVFQFHILHNDHGERPHAVLIHQNILTFYRLQISRQIAQ